MIHFTSDQHYGHSNIIGYCSRPFANVEAMDASMIERHNATVAPSDVVYHLGDFAMKQPRVAEILAALNGTHHLIAGNHDRCHPVHKRTEKRMREYVAAGFVTVNEQAIVDLPGLGEVFLCHLPQGGDPAERYHEQRPVDSAGARWQFCGHVHELWKRRGNMINVGVDQWDFAPVSLERLRKELEAT